MEMQTAIGFCKEIQKKAKRTDLQKNARNSYGQEIVQINQATRGWINYYAFGSMKTAMKYYHENLWQSLIIIIFKLCKVPKTRQWGLQKLGIGKDLARLTAYCGDQYYWVATKICVVRAISKDVFTGEE